MAITKARLGALEALAKKELTIVERLVSEAVGLPSQWSGRVFIEKDAPYRGTKPFGCDIRLSAWIMETDERERTYRHEMLHAHSAGYIEADFRIYMGWEEGVVEQLQRLLRKRFLASLPPYLWAESSLSAGDEAERNHLYNIYIAALETLRDALNLDPKMFYKELLGEPMGRRSAYVLTQYVMKRKGNEREAAKQAYMKASAVLKRNLNNESVAANPLLIQEEVEKASQFLFGNDSGPRLPSGLLLLLERVLGERTVARTPDDFRRLRQELNHWFVKNQVSPSEVDIMPELIEGLWREEQFARTFETEAAQMGLTYTEKEERWQLIKDVPLANTQQELDTARALVSHWLARFPQEENADRWQSLLNTQQMALDLMEEQTLPPFSATRAAPLEKQRVTA